MIEYIKYHNEVAAVILRRDFSKDGANFFSALSDPFQFGVLQYKKGKHIQAHRHIKALRRIDLVCEVLFIQKGKVEVSFYDEGNNKIDSKILAAGDTILMRELGHSFELLEDSKIIEIKQGPYLGREKDKEYLEL